MSIVPENPNRKAKVSCDPMSSGHCSLGSAIATSMCRSSQRGERLGKKKRHPKVALFFDTAKNQIYMQISLSPANSKKDAAPAYSTPSINSE